MPVGAAAEAFAGTVSGAPISRYAPNAKNKISMINKTPNAPPLLLCGLRADESEVLAAAVLFAEDREDFAEVFLRVFAEEVFLSDNSKYLTF
jgi:hypothetical protein